MYQDEQPDQRHPAPPSQGSSAILAVALAARSELGWWSGQWAAAYADAAESLRWAEETGQTASIGYSLARLARIDAARGEQERCLGTGDVKTAIEHLERAWGQAWTVAADSADYIACVCGPPGMAEGPFPGFPGRAGYPGRGRGL